jgi:hypothetical protein
LKSTGWAIPNPGFIKIKEIKEIMNQVKHILVTNDDGVMHPDYWRWHRERKIANAHLAPDRNWSGSDM